MNLKFARLSILVLVLAACYELKAPRPGPGEPGYDPLAASHYGGLPGADGAEAAAAGDDVGPGAGVATPQRWAMAAGRPPVTDPQVYRAAQEWGQDYGEPAGVYYITRVLSVDTGMADAALRPYVAAAAARLSAVPTVVDTGPRRATRSVLRQRPVAAPPPEVVPLPPSPRFGRRMAFAANPVAGEVVVDVRDADRLNRRGYERGDHGVVYVGDGPLPEYGEVLYPAQSDDMRVREEARWQEIQREKRVGERAAIRDQPVAGRAALDARVATRSATPVAAPAPTAGDDMLGGQMLVADAHGRVRGAGGGGGGAAAFDPALGGGSRDRGGGGFAGTLVAPVPRGYGSRSGPPRRARSP